MHRVTCSKVVRIPEHFNFQTWRRSNIILSHAGHLPCFASPSMRQLNKNINTSKKIWTISRAHRRQKRWPHMVATGSSGVCSHTLQLKLFLLGRTAWEAVTEDGVTDRKVDEGITISSTNSKRKHEFRLATYGHTPHLLHPWYWEVGEKENWGLWKTCVSQHENYSFPANPLALRLRRPRKGPGSVLIHSSGNSCSFYTS